MWPSSKLEYEYAYGKMNVIDKHAFDKMHVTYSSFGRASKRAPAPALRGALANKVWGGGSTGGAPENTLSGARQWRTSHKRGSTRLRLTLLSSRGAARLRWRPAMQIRKAQTKAIVAGRKRRGWRLATQAGKPRTRLAP